LGTLKSPAILQGVVGRAVTLHEGLIFESLENVTHSRLRKGKQGTGRRLAKQPFCQPKRAHDSLTEQLPPSFHPGPLLDFHPSHANTPRQKGLDGLSVAL
jgi:hypothetical protein